MVGSDSPWNRSSTNAAHIDTRGVRRELRFFIEQYRQGRRETTDLLFSEGLKTRELVSQVAARVDQHFNRQVLSQRAQEDEQAAERFHQSLRDPEFNKRRNQIRVAFEDTLEWVFAGDDEEDLGSKSELTIESNPEARNSGKQDKHQELLSNIKWDSFSNWLRSTDPIYWISGKPGSGKTTLVKYIVAHSRTRRYLDVWSPGCHIASHYFWRPGSPMQRNLEGLFCSLLFQLLGSNSTSLGDVMSLISGPKYSFTDWSSAELLSALSTTLDSCTNGVCLFLDGLDEIYPEDGTKDGIPELLDLVSRLSKTGKTKFCLASRSNPHILEMRLSMHPKLRLQDLNHADLVVYARKHVKYSEPETSTKYDATIDLLVSTAQGVFLWLILAIKSINEGISYHDSADVLNERINRLPKDLDTLYQDMWTRTGADSPSEYRKKAALYFKLLLSERRSNFHWRESDVLCKLPSVVLRMNAFDFMLATTPIADGILNALDEPSKLIGQDVIQKSCREVKRSLRVYCMGLVEERGTDDTLSCQQASDWCWYGHTYDSIWPVANAPRLEFIHRTAADFLTDTKAGSEILSLDTSSDFDLYCQRMKAWLARHAMFASSESAGHWAAMLAKTRTVWEDTKEWESNQWDRFVLICEKLANSGMLFKGIVRAVEPCGCFRFLSVLAEHGIGDEIIISRLQSTDLDDNGKSAILLGLSKSFQNGMLGSVEKLPRRLRTIRELLLAGADPNYQAWETDPVHMFKLPQTPWLTYLLGLLSDLTASGIKWPPNKLANMADIAFAFISEGANLGTTVDMFLRLDSKCVATEIGYSMYRWAEGVLASIPAYLIIYLLTETLRLHSESTNESYLHNCVDLEQACLHHSSSRTCRVFGKYEVNIEDGTGSVFETTDEMQTSLGNILIEALKRQISSAGPIFGPESDSESDLEMNDSGLVRMRDLILDDESWVKVARGMRRKVVWEWLVAKGLAKSASERLGIREWVRRHNHALPQSG
jgi:hypothetical protein